MRNVEGKERPVCPQCGETVYHDPKVAAAVVVERDEKILMVRRAVEPGLGMWSLPGGYVDRGEVVERAAEREVMEETGLEIEATGLVGVFSESGHPVILITYDCRILGGKLMPGPEVMELDFFSPDHLPPLAFPRDRQILDTWKSLRGGHCRE
jgi:ADP-ribose pyrophosphatase YjhB (NUDIX family)